MEFMDGNAFGQTYYFGLTDNTNTHYYVIFAKTWDYAIATGRRWFKEKYGTESVEIYKNCTGMPLTRNI